MVQQFLIYTYLKYPSGGLAVAVPGELKGYSTIYDLYGSGKISWESLFEPTIKLCENGIKISDRLEINMKNHEELIKNDPFLRYDEKICYFVIFKIFLYSRIRLGEYWVMGYCLHFPTTSIN